MTIGTWFENIYIYISDQEITLHNCVSMPTPIHIFSLDLSFILSDNMIKQCAFVHVGPKNITMDAATSANSDYVFVHVGSKNITMNAATSANSLWTNTHCLIMLCTYPIPQGLNKLTNPTNGRVKTLITM